jgi:ATPase subunit of ABC transporter with duplicated ATPase domains
MWLRNGVLAPMGRPNGVGKTTFLELVAKGTAEGVSTPDGVTIGYYRQDFHNFDFDSTVMDCLQEACNGR